MQRFIQRLAGFLSELKRRKVYRVVFVYCVGAYAVLELSDIVLPVLGAPDGALALVLALVVAGLPMALLLGWMYDLTQAGLQRDPQDGPPVRYSRAGRAIRTVVVIAASGLLGWASWSLARSPAEADVRGQRTDDGGADGAIVEDVVLNHDVGVEQAGTEARGRTEVHPVNVALADHQSTPSRAARLRSSALRRSRSSAGSPSA